MKKVTRGKGTKVMNLRETQTFSHSRMKKRFDRKKEKVIEKTLFCLKGGFIELVLGLV